jgi:hypothetical protein
MHQLLMYENASDVLCCFVFVFVFVFVVIKEIEVVLQIQILRLEYYV